MKSYLSIALFGVLSFPLCSNLAAQSPVVENAIPLTKTSTDGYFYEIKNQPGGAVDVTFEYADKKTQKFETYSMDNALKLKSTDLIASIPTKGEMKKDYTRNALWAYIGGSTSFDVLSSKLKLNKVVYNYKWNLKKQRYDRITTSREKAVLKNAEEKPYEGYIAFGNETNGNIMVLTSIEDKTSKAFYLLNIKDDLSFEQIPIKLDGKKTLVYAFAAQKTADAYDEDDITDGDMVFVFANMGKDVDTKKYVLLRYDNKGKLLNQMDFTAPSPNLAITSASVVDNNLFLFGSYTKSKDAFFQIFKEYGPMPSPGFAANDKLGDQNYRMSKWNGAINGEDMVSMVCMKISESKIDWIKDYPISEMAKLAQKAPNQKKPIVYDGGPLAITKFKVLSNGDMLITGQTSGRVSLGLANPYKAYKKLVCFHLDPNGNMRAQYGAAPESLDDKINTIYPMVQDFILSSDNNTIYWLVLENETHEGYDGYFDALNGTKTLRPRYYPSIVKIDVAKATLSNVEELGSRKYYLNTASPVVYGADNKDLLFVGRDPKNKTLWLCRYQLN